MRIVYIYKSIALLAGMERILVDKMNYLADKLGYDIYLITYEQGIHPLSFPISTHIKHIDLGVLFYSVSKFPFPKRFWQYLKLRKSFKQKLYQTVRQINPDVVVATNYSYPQLDIIAGIPGRSKRIIELHISKEALLKSSEQTQSFVLRKIARIYDLYMLRQIKKFDRLVTLTEQDKKRWETIYPTATVIPNILTLYPNEQARLESNSIISVGRLEAQKGYDLLIEAWRSVTLKHPDWKMHIYGDGSCKALLTDMIRAAKIETSFILHQADPNIYQQYLKHSFYVMSSRFEGFGLVLIEAMSCGLPCISFDCPSGPAEIIKDGEDGILVENGNIIKLSEAICYMIEHEEKRKELGSNARLNVLRYSQEDIMLQWDALFRGLTQLLTVTSQTSGRGS